MLNPKRLLSALLAATFCLPAAPDHALRPSIENGIQELVQAGMEEASAFGRKNYRPEALAGQLLDVLSGIDSLSSQKFFDPKTGVVTLNPERVANLLGKRPSQKALTMPRQSGKTLFSEISTLLAAPETAPASLEPKWRQAFGRGIFKIQMAKSREGNGAPWTDRRLEAVMSHARKKKLSFRPARIDKGSQPKTPLGLELKKAYGQVTRTDHFPQYKRSWPLFLEEHGIRAEDIYDENRPPEAKETFEAYVDLKRDEKGLPIPDRRKYVATLKIARLDSLWKNPRVLKAETVFLIGVRTYANQDKNIYFSVSRQPYAVNIPVEGFDPAQPISLAVELKVKDPHHAPQIARRMDTAKIVYPFDGQMRFYLEPPFQKGKVQEGAYLYRALTQVRDPFWEELRKTGAKEVFATHVQTVHRSEERRTAAHFHVGMEGIKATSLNFLPSAPHLLTARLDPVSQQSLEAWEMRSGRPVFPVEGFTAAPIIRVFSDPPTWPNGLVAEGTKPAAEVSGISWDKVWAEAAKDGVKSIVLQGPSTQSSDRSATLLFYFNGEPDLTPWFGQVLERV